MNWAMRVLGLERLEGVEALEDREEGREGEGRLRGRRAWEGRLVGGKVSG